uniref:Uncharacterized protein n=1 Tax=Rhizophora mucronata TaxID=61149 RepID=A0A2P2NGG3_RHIMU
MSRIGKIGICIVKQLLEILGD